MPTSKGKPRLLERYHSIRGSRRSKTNLNKPIQGGPK